MNRPSVTIFGPTPWFRNAYETPRNKMVHTGKTVDPNALDRNDFSIREIPETEVIKTVHEVLAAG